MMNLLGLFSNIKSTITTCIIGIAVIIILVILLKSDKTRIFTFYLLCILLIISGIYSGIGLYKEMKAESYVNGSINVDNLFDSEKVSYASNSIVFYHDTYDETDNYYYNIDLTKVSTFDGEENTYEIKLNDYLILNAEVLAGEIRFDAPFSIRLTDGSTPTIANLNVSVRFLTDKTQLKLTTTGGQNATYLQKYFEDCGFKLEITTRKI